MSSARRFALRFIELERMRLVLQAFHEVFELLRLGKSQVQTGRFAPCAVEENTNRIGSDLTAFKGAVGFVSRKGGKLRRN
jgi:hypothetical protein